VAEGPDAGRGVRGGGFSGVGKIVPGLTEARVLDEGHFGISRLDGSRIRSCVGIRKGKKRNEGKKELESLKS